MRVWIVLVRREDGDIVDSVWSVKAKADARAWELSTMGHKTFRDEYEIDRAAGKDFGNWQRS